MVHKGELASQEAKPSNLIKIGQNLKEEMRISRGNGEVLDTADLKPCKFYRIDSTKGEENAAEHTKVTGQS